MSTRRGFLRALGLGAATVVAGSTPEVQEVVRRYWAGWRAPLLGAGPVSLPIGQDGRVLHLHQGQLQWMDDAPMLGYVQGAAKWGSNMGALPIPVGFSERYIAVVREPGDLRLGDLVEWDERKPGTVRAATSESTVLGAIVSGADRVWAVQTGGLVRIPYSAPHAAGQLIRLG